MIGYIGLGHMGGALARRLAHANDILVYDQDPLARSRMAEAGIAVAEDAASLARSCAMVFLCLPTSQHVQSALFGAEGWADALRPGTVLIDQTSGDPAITRHMAAELRTRDITLIDAPVSGGPQGAAAGTIAIMLGCEDDTLARVTPVLQTISPNIFHAGGVGAGNVAKLANNLLSGGIRLLTLEAVTLAVKNGLSPETAVSIFKASGGNSYWLEKYGDPLLVRGEVAGTFTLGLIQKDVRLACDMARASDTPLLMGNQAKEVYQLAVNRYGAQAAVNTIAFFVETCANANYIPKHPHSPRSDPVS